MPMHRIHDECDRALYQQPSELRRRDKQTKQWTSEIGQGLFSTMSYKRNEVIAEFKGTWRSLMEWEEIAAKEPWRRAYSIIASEHGDILDCFDHFKKGNCIASYSNSPIACIDLTTNTKAVANSRIKVSGKRIFLVCGVNKVGSRSPKHFVLQPHKEILWNYESSFISYT